MRTVILALAAASVLVSAQPPVPTFPVDWTAIVSDSVVINQGGTTNPDGSICCDATSPECKIQTAYQIGKQFFGYSLNKTALRAPDNSGIVTDFTVGKEYQVDSQNNCQAYCPLGANEDQLFPFGIDPNATFMGIVPCGVNQSCNLFQFREAIPILNITLEITDDYVSTCDGKPCPVWELDYIEPFGEDLGTENTTWYSWVPGTPAASAFTVNGADTCQLSNDCGSDDTGGSGSNDIPLLDSDLAQNILNKIGFKVPGRNVRSVTYSRIYQRYLDGLQAKAQAQREAILAALPARFRALQTLA